MVLASRLQDTVAPELFQAGLDMAKDMNGGMAGNVGVTSGVLTDILVAGVMPEFEKPKSLEQGASTILRAALDPSLAGEYKMREKHF